MAEKRLPTLFPGSAPASSRNLPRSLKARRKINFAVRSNPGPRPGQCRRLAGRLGASGRRNNALGHQDPPGFRRHRQQGARRFHRGQGAGQGRRSAQVHDEHDKEQWDKLKSLPNLIYTDGNAFSLWRDGKLEGEIVRLEGDVETSGAKLAAPPTLLPLISDFLRGRPFRRRPPSNSRKSARASAACCATKSSSRWRAAARPDRPRGRLAQAAVSASRRCAVRRRLCAGGDLRASGRAGAGHFARQGHGRGGAGTAQIELADRHRAAAA